MPSSTALVLRRALLMIVRYIDKHPGEPLPAPVLRRAFLMFVRYVEKQPQLPDHVSAAVAIGLGYAADSVESNESV